MKTHRKPMLIVSALCAILTLFALPVGAGDLVLTNNTGEESSVWFISGEASLVMNGFDLTPLALQLPAVIDRVSIDVAQAVPGTPIQAVVYQDANGGSPVDATLIGETQVTISQTGVFTATFNPPVLVTQPVVWAGFFLPEGFRFRADTSGSSVLTYWAWTPGGDFDLNALSSAQVLGPADGSGPVNIDMSGIARITAEIGTDRDADRVPDTTDNCDAVFNPTQADANGDSIGDACDPTNPTGPEAESALPTTTLTSTTGSGDTGVLRAYPNCPTLSFDAEDIEVSFRDAINLHCQEVWPGFAPESPAGFERKQLLYDISIFDDQGVVAHELDTAVTHCIRPNPADAGGTLAVGRASGAPRTWEILPGQRFGDLICAEVFGGGNLSYFVSLTAPPPAAQEAQADGG